MSVVLANFLFEVVNFALLAGALAWLLFKPVREALDAERERAARERREIEAARAAAQALDEEARATRARAEAEIEARRQELIDGARAEAARIEEEARAGAARERRRLESELETATRAQAQALADTLGRVAGESVRRLLVTLDGPALDEALVRAACAELAALAVPAGEPAGVESARPLTETSRRALAAVLPAGFEEHVVADLGAGVRVTTAAGQVDASAAGIGRHAARAIADAAAREGADG